MEGALEPNWGSFQLGEDASCHMEAWEGGMYKCSQNRDRCPDKQDRKEEKWRKRRAAASASQVQQRANGTEFSSVFFAFHQMKWKVQGGRYAQEQVQATALTGQLPTRAPAAAVPAPDIVAAACCMPDAG